MLSIFYFGAVFEKLLRIFAPTLENPYAYKKKHVYGQVLKKYIISNFISIF